MMKAIVGLVTAASRRFYSIMISERELRLRNEAILDSLAAKAVVLGFSQSFDGPKVGSLGFRLIALDIAQSIVGIGEGGGDAAIIVHAGQSADTVPSFVGPDVEIHRGSLDTAGSEEPPVVDGHQFYKHQLGSVGRLIAFDGRPAQFLVGDFVFVRQHRGFRGHSMLQGIESCF
jgi:hypothetical protein